VHAIGKSIRRLGGGLERESRLSRPPGSGERDEPRILAVEELDDLPELASLPVPLVVSVAGFSHDEFARLVEGVEERPEVAALELNVSCPNVKSGCVMGSQPGETSALMRVLRPLTAKPLIVKLTPNVADPASVARAAEQGGADAVSLINTLKATAVDPASLQPSLGAGRGGLSGPAVRPIALEQVRAVAAAVGIPVIGMGGIESGADALQFIAAGAGAVAVGTANFRDPLAGERVRIELAEGLRRAGLSGIAELRGRAVEIERDRVRSVRRDSGTDASRERVLHALLDLGEMLEGRRRVGAEDLEVDGGAQPEVRGGRHRGDRRDGRRWCERVQRLRWRDRRNRFGRGCRRHRFSRCCRGHWRRWF